MIHVCDSTVKIMLSAMLFICNIYSKNQTSNNCFDKRRGDFFPKREKKGMCFFVVGSKTICTKVPSFTKKYITSIYIQIVYKCFLQNQKLYTRTLNYRKYKASVLLQDLVGNFVKELVDNFVHSIVNNFDYIKRLVDRRVSFRVIWLRRQRKLSCIETQTSIIAEAEKLTKLSYK
jgi:hypothetical protein